MAGGQLAVEVVWWGIEWALTVVLQALDHKS